MPIRTWILALFDTTSAEADFKEALAKVSALSSRLSRLNAEVFETQPVFPEVSFKHPQFIDNESALFRKRMDAQKEELDALAAILALVLLSTKAARKSLIASRCRPISPPPSSSSSARIIITSRTKSVFKGMIQHCVCTRSRFYMSDFYM